MFGKDFLHRLFAILILLVVLPGAGAIREQVRVVGSSTAFPYAQAVAEEMTEMTEFPSPVVEATGSGGGMRIFCAGLGPRTPDVTTASRRIRPSEIALCRERGVGEITEARFGLDAVVLARARGGATAGFTRSQLFQGLAAEVAIGGEIVTNPFRRWSEINPALPDEPILVYGPPYTSGTRDALVDLVMNEGCMEFSAIASLPPAARTSVCGRIRQDGAFIAAGESDNVIVRRLVADPAAVGVFGYSLLALNAERLRGISLDGVAPSREAIASGAYGAIRPLYFYVKSAHLGVITGLDHFLAEFTSEAAIGPGGYLVERGLVPLSEDERVRLRLSVAAGEPLAGY